MNYLLFRRLRGPIFLLTFGVTALLHEWDVLSFGQSWPLYLIVLGVLQLTERAILASSPTPLAGSPAYPAPAYPSQGFTPAATTSQTGLATIAPAPLQTTHSVESLEEES